MAKHRNRQVLSHGFVMDEKGVKMSNRNGMP